MQNNKPKAPAIVWHQPNGDPLTCFDKIAVLNDNLAELHQECQDVLEDALLMGCDETQIRDTLKNLVKALENPFKK